MKTNSPHQRETKYDPHQSPQSGKNKATISTHVLLNVLSLTVFVAPKVALLLAVRVAGLP